MPAFPTPRPLTCDELRAVDRLARARTESARAVERTRIVRRAHKGDCVPAIVRVLGIATATVRRGLNRCDAEGVAAPRGTLRPGRRPAYDADAVGEAVAVGRPAESADLGPPFGRWTRDRLTAYPRVGNGLADPGTPVRRAGRSRFRRKKQLSTTLSGLIWGWEGASRLVTAEDRVEDGQQLVHAGGADHAVRAILVGFPAARSRL